MIKLQEILNYVINHPSKSKCLKDWSESNIVNTISDSFSANGLDYYKENNVLHGIVIAFPDPITKTVWVTCLICDTRKAFKHFINTFRVLYPDYTLAARRHGKIKTFREGKTERICNFISPIYI